MFALLINDQPTKEQESADQQTEQAELQTNRKINNHNKQRTWSAISKRIAKLQHYKDESSEQSADDIKTQIIPSPMIIQHQILSDSESTEDRLFYIFQSRLDDNH